MIRETLKKLSGDDVTEMLKGKKPTFYVPHPLKYCFSSAILNSWKDVLDRKQIEELVPIRYKEALLNFVSVKYEEIMTLYNIQLHPDF